MLQYQLNMIERGSKYKDSKLIFKNNSYKITPKNTNCSYKTYDIVVILTDFKHENSYFI